MTRCTLLFAAALLAALTGSALAVLTPAQETEARALVAQLSSARLDLRSEAAEKLVAMGVDVVPLVKAAMAASRDTEVRMLCAGVLEALPDPAKLVEKRVQRLGPRLLVYDDYPTLSPDGERIVGTLRKGNDNAQFLVLNGAEIDASQISVSGFVFSGDGARIAWRSHGRKSCTVTCDGVPGPELADFPWGITFSPDGRRLGYYVRHGGQWVDGHCVGARHFVVVDGVQGPVYDAAWFPVFSPDSRHVAHVGGRGEKRFMVVDGKEGPVYDDVQWPVYSPDGRLACCVAHDKQWFVLIDGREASPGYPLTEIFGQVSFSADGKHASWDAGAGEKRYGVVRDGVMGKTYGGVSGGVFSPDGSRLAHLAWQDRSAFVVCDGKEGPRFDEAGWQLVFSGDGGHLAYAARREAIWRIVCDDRLSPGYPDAGEMVRHGFRPVFSPDGRHLAYKAGRGRDEFIVCDGVEGPRHAWARLPKRFDKVPGKLRYAVMDDDGAWLVEVDWPQDRDWTSGVTAAP